MTIEQLKMDYLERLAMLPACDYEKAKLAYLDANFKSAWAWNLANTTIRELHIYGSTSRTDEISE